MNDDTSTKLSRRGFLGGAGVSAAATVLLDSATAGAAGEPEAVTGSTPLTLTVNGAKKSFSAEPRTTLAAALRNELGLTGTKVVCDRGACSACTVHVDGTPMLACTLLAVELQGRKITPSRAWRRATPCTRCSRPSSSRTRCSAASARRAW